MACVQRKMVVHGNVVVDVLGNIKGLVTGEEFKMDDAFLVGGVEVYRITVWLSCGNTITVMIFILNYQAACLQLLKFHALFLGFGFPYVSVSN